MSAANRKRGQRAEVAVVNYLRDHDWPDARRYLSGDLRIRGTMGTENEGGPGAVGAAPDRGQHLDGGAVMAHRTCSVEGCEKPHYGRGLCSPHYQRHRRAGTMPDTRKPDAVARFWSKVDKRPGGCWLWTGTMLRSGYGQFRLGLGHVRAHRFAYELLVGPIPEGLTLDHLCRVTACVNPLHLEPVTLSENVKRAVPFR